MSLTRTTASAVLSAQVTGTAPISTSDAAGVITIVAAMASNAEALAGTVTDKIMSPAADKAARDADQATVAALLATKANLASPTLTGTPRAPTAPVLEATTQIATTQFVTAAGALKADLASPTFTGTPAAPTASPGTNTTQLATTAFAQDLVTSVAKWGVVPGATDLATKLQAAIDAAAVVVSSAPAANSTVTAKLLIPAGVYELDGPIALKTGVTLEGASIGATTLRINHSGDGISITTGQYGNVWVRNMQIRNAGPARYGVSVVGLIRNCGFQNVLVDGFTRNWDFADTWTTTLINCYGYNATENNLYLGSGVGLFNVHGGRYDWAGLDSVYIDNSTAQPTFRDVCIQFAQRSGIKAANVRAILIENCYLEGCAKAGSYYYIDLNGSGTSVSYARIINSSITSLGNPAEDGLGIIYADDFVTFEYEEGWVNNGTSALPVLGGSVTKYSVHAPNTSPAVNRTVRTGVAGLQARGSSTALELNPEAGDLKLGQSGATIGAGTNEYRGRYRPAAQITTSNASPAATAGYVGIDCTSGSKTVDMVNHTAVSGRRLTVGKRDAGANTITITPASGTINGSATLVLSAAYEHVTLVCDGTNWFVENRS